MPKTANEVFRDYTRWTGDGLPNEPVGHPLPYGDPRSGKWNPPKHDIREAFRGAFDAADIALGAAADIQGATLFAANIPALAANATPAYTTGTLFLTRLEGAAMRVLAPSDTRPHLVTAGGVKLAVERWERDDRGALAQIGRRAQFGEAVRIACYGDSTTLGVDGVTETYNNYPNRLGSILRTMTGNTDIATYNCGSGGKKAIDWWAFDNYAAMVTTPFPLSEYVMLGFGLNDIKYDGSPDWNPALFKERYLYLINQVRLSGRIPIIMAPITVSAAPIRPNPLIQGQLLNAVREVAEEAKVDLVDFNACMQAWQRDRTDQYRIGDYQTDGTHPSDDVYVALAGYIVRQIFRHRIIDVSHGSRLGPQDSSYSPDVSVAYNYLMNNAWGYSARLTAAANVNIAAEVWVWSDRARKAVYVSPDRSVVSGASPAYAYVGKAGTADEVGVQVAFGTAGSATTERPAENHLHVADLPFGLSRLRMRAGGAGVFEFGGWLVVDSYDPVSVSAYSVATDRMLYLPDYSDSRPEVVAKFAGSTNLALMGNLPVGWGVVIGTQYVYYDAGDAGPSRRKQSIVVLRTASGADILRVLSGATGVFAATSIKTSGTGAWAGQITVHATTDAGGNAQIQVRADGQVIAAHTNAGTDAFMSPYGRLGGLYRDPALVTDPAGRQAVATLVPMPV